MDRLLEKKDVLSPILMSKGLPRNWQMYTEDEYKSNNGYIKVQLDQSSEEFVKVAQLFNSRGCGNINVLKIFRIQNPKLYRIFFCNLHQVRKKHASQSNIEIQKYLFHGSSYGNMEKIADQGFDYRLCGVNGTAYGQGNYFAYHSSYSLGYSRSSGSEKMMFLAMVITGSYTHGNSGLSIAPKDSKGIPYDSVVDNTSNPQIFVTFDNFKAYPAYVLIFK
jgi:poly [ADP-ribose] polymerase 7/11/12/13